MAFIVIKFGGTSVSNLDSWKNIASIAQTHIDNNLRPVIVCSAPSQVSNLLETLLDQAPENEHAQTYASIKNIFHELADRLDLDFFEHLDACFEELKQTVLGISLLQEASPKTKARVMAFGEIILTRLANAYLIQNKISSHWLDVRLLLQSIEQQHHSVERQYLSADCDFNKDKKLISTLSKIKTTVFVTQGFIASNKRHETVLLGRGGSDVSAAYLSAKLDAVACEIWTDVPGVYTTNPHLILEARLLKSLSYAEAQEIASMGAKVLHPRCISPLKQNHIPLSIKYTREPDRAGTSITIDPSGEAQIKSILIKKEVVLISIEAVNMWQTAGFLAEIFDCFKSHALSVDLISTSESNVTVSLDTKANLIDAKSLDALTVDLNHFSQATVIGPCAVIGLVGHQIRTILHKLGNVFSIFDSKRIHLLTQAANDLSLAFVVDEDDALAIAQKIHNQLIEQNVDSLYFGSSWQIEFGEELQTENAWWRQHKDKLLQLTANDSPLYVYQTQKLQQQAESLLALKSIDQVFYAIKANSHPNILKLFFDLGLSFECVSIEEVQCILQLFPAIDRQKILFTPNFADQYEYAQAIKLGVHVTIDNLYPLQAWPKIFSQQDIILRVDPGYGYGHHKYVTTGGKDSKFGIPVDHLKEVAQLAKQYKYNIIGLHAHSGSGISHVDNWKELALFLIQRCQQFPSVKYIDLGGGLGIAERPGQKAIDISEVDEALIEIKLANPGLELWIEPGRYLVAEAGVLLARVTQLKQKTGMNYVGINAGMNSFIRPALYGAYHEIVNLSKLDYEKTMTASIVGPICESADTLGYSRLLPDTKEGDILLIANTGAYGASMSSNYNLRPCAKEVLL